MHVLDLATFAPAIGRRPTERAMDEAEVLRLFDRRAFEAVLAAHPTAPGARMFADVLAGHTVGSTLTRTDLEEPFLGARARARSTVRLSTGSPRSVAYSDTGDAVLLRSTRRTGSGSRSTATRHR
ncbi:MAG: hypothetical protein U0S48_14125 [Solirubrobacteraceae bacterium]